MASLNQHQRLTCFLGTGGVGKTTLASFYALKLAKDFPDARIKLVTIDPSNRLKSFFGIKEGESCIQMKNLFVELNDREALLKGFVERVAKEKNISSDQILKNKIFVSLMEGLAVSQEFSSLYELERSYRSNDYDFIVLDTPPLQNTADFLKSAEGLNAFFSSALAKFFLSKDEQGFLYKVINSARRNALAVLSRLTGLDFVNEMAFFFKAVEQIRESLLEVIQESKSILSQKADVVVVGNANELSLAGLKVALTNLSSSQLKIKKCIINKYDKTLKNLSVEKRIENLKSSFPEKTYIILPKFDFEPSSREDLMKLVDHVEF